MNDILDEIKNLAKNGYETAILNNESNSKDIFLKILFKTELAQNQQTDIIRTYNKHNADAKSRAYMVAYCFSTYGHRCLFPAHTQTDAFDIAGRKLGFKRNTIKGFRDMFDGDNNECERVGWQRPLPTDMQEFKDANKHKSRAALIDAAKEILGIK